MQNKLDPKPLELGILDDMRKILYDLRALEQETQAKGIVEPIEPVTVNSQRRRFLAQGGKWHSFSVINDGPNSVWILVNPMLSNDPHRVDDGEVHTIDFHRARISEVVMWCDPGGHADLRVVGLK